MRDLLIISKLEQLDCLFQGNAFKFVLYRHFIIFLAINCILNSFQYIDRSSWPVWTTFTIKITNRIAFMNIFRFVILFLNFVNDHYSNQIYKLCFLIELTTALGCHFAYSGCLPFNRLRLPSQTNTLIFCYFVLRICWQHSPELFLSLQAAIDFNLALLLIYLLNLFQN